MKIRIYPDHPNLPIGPAMGRVGSAMPLAIVGVPSGATAVSIAITNADGTAYTAAATKQGGEWLAVVPASHFAAYGAISRGMKVSVTFKDATDTSQTVLFLGDVRIEQTAAGDPSGTGTASVPVTEVAEVADGSTMEDIRDKVNEIARIVSGTATALMLAFCAFGASPIEKIPGTNLVYTAAETDAAIVRLAPPGITTNDVCNIVTNTITGFTDWTFSPATNIEEGIARYDFGYEGGNQWMLAAYNENDEAVFALFADGGPDATSLTFGSFYTATRTFMPPSNALGLAGKDDLPPLTNNIPATYQARLPYPTNAIPYSVISGAPSAGGITTNDVCAIVTNATSGFTTWAVTRNDLDVTSSVPQPGYGETPYGNGWLIFGILGDTIDDPYLVLPRNVTSLAWTATDGGGDTVRYSATRSPVIRNNLGVAGQSGAVSEILLIGTDGKMYHLRIGSGGSIEVYMEAN